ncbi:uncharacterized protein [Panulirus ornatus]
MGSVGLALFFLGCSLVNSGGKMKEIGIFMIIFGVMGVLSCCFLCDKAHRDYKALPEDHPDRIKYSGVVPVPIRNIGTTCQLPPGTQVVSYPASTGGQAVGSSSTGRETVRHPPSTGRQAVGSSSTGRETVRHPPSTGRQIVGSSSTGRKAVGSPSTGGQTVCSPSTGRQAVGSPSTGGQPIGSPSTGGQPIGSPSTRGQPIGSPSTGGQAESRVTPSAPPASTQYAYDDAPPSYAEATKNTMQI